MQVELLCNGGYKGMDACIGKVFTTLGESNSNGSVRIPVDILEQAGFINDEFVNTSLYFFDWEVRILNG